MSLIQEALEKAGKIQQTEKFYELPERLKPEPFQPKAPKVKKAAVLSKAVEIKPAPKIEISSQFLIRAGIAAGLILFFWAASFILSRGGKSSGVMVAGVSSAASHSSMLPAASPVPKFTLTGITDSGTGKLALINDQVAGIGDRLKEQAFVKQIGENYAVLDYNGKEIQLTL